MNDWASFFSAVAAGAGVGGLLVWGLAAILITVVVAAWIARDASTRGLEAPWAWALGAAFQPLIVLAVYFFTRETLTRRVEVQPRPAPGPA